VFATGDDDGSVITGRVACAIIGAIVADPARSRSVHMSDERRFQDLVRRSAPLNYATRCRVVADEVRRQHDAPNPPAAVTWLDEQLAVLAAEPGTVAQVALQAASPAVPGSAPMRAWAHAQVRPTDPEAWKAGADSRSMWALLMAPAPDGDEELNWLAQSSGVEPSDLRALLSGRMGVQD
jgi:hypothetical protein